MSEPKTQQEHEAALIVGIGSHGVAAIGLVRNLFRVLRLKGVLSDVELAAIFDGTIEQARGAGDAMSERFAEAVRQTIHDLANSVLVAPHGSVKH